MHSCVRACVCARVPAYFIKFHLSDLKIIFLTFVPNFYRNVLSKKILT